MRSTVVVMVSPARRAQALRRALRDDRKVKVNLPLTRFAVAPAADPVADPASQSAAVPTAPARSATSITTTPTRSTTTGRTSTPVAVTPAGRARALRRALRDDRKVKVRF